jgi:hypothetical protein
MMVRRRSVWLGVEFGTATTLLVACRENLAKGFAFDKYEYA